MSKEIKFALMNILIKGAPASIERALREVSPDSYELQAFTYDPKKVNPNDTTIVKAGLVFDAWYEGFMSKDDVPFVAIPDIKFIGLGNGGDGGHTDGSYVFYKLHL